MNCKTNAGVDSGALKSGKTTFNFVPEPGQTVSFRFIYQYTGAVDPASLTYTDPQFGENTPLPLLSYYLMIGAEAEYVEGEEIPLPFEAVKEFLNSGFYSVIFDLEMTSTSGTESETETTQILFTNINTDKKTYLSGTTVLGEKATLTYALDMEEEKLTFTGSSSGKGVIKEGKLELLNPETGDTIDVGVYQYLGDVDPGSIMFDFGDSGLTPLPMFFMAGLHNYNDYENAEEIFDAIFNSKLLNVVFQNIEMGLGQGYVNNIYIDGDYIRYHFALADDKEVFRAYHRISRTEMEEVYDFNLINRLNDLEMGLSENVVSSVTVGAIDAGTVVPAGTTFDEFVKMTLQKTFYPTLTNPSISVTNNLGSKELGTTANVIITVTLDRGQILGATSSGVWNPSLSQGDRAGAATKYIIAGEDRGLTNTYTLSHTVTSTSQQIVGRVDYDAGLQPVDSNGSAFGSPLPSGFLEGNTTLSAGYRKSFWGALSNANEPSTSQDIRALPSSSSFQLSNGSTFVITVPPNSQQVVIAYPSTLRTLTSVIYVEGGNVQIVGDFVTPKANNYQKTISVNDYSGSNATDYKVYGLVFADPTPTTMTLNVII